MAPFTVPTCVAVFVAGLSQVNGNAFLHKLDVEMESVSAQAVEQTLMTELALIGRDQHLQELQGELRTMYEALPKNAAGRLDASVVRYALHRFFAQARGWFVQGLQPSGESRNASMPVKIMKDRVPAFIQTLLESRVHGEGLNLEELAAFAATIEDLIHAESVHHLTRIFEVSGWKREMSLSTDQMQEAVDSYFMQYIVGGEINAVRLQKLKKEVLDIYPAWPDVAMWSRDLKQTLSHNRQSRHNPFKAAGGDSSFDEVANFVREAGYHFGAFQDQECRAMKDTLVDMEYRGTGRVRLSEFYKGSLEGNWQFAENVDYLRAIGALDESNPRMPSVLIANYVGSQSNCLASSSFYSVCCLDECEGLMSKLEQSIGGATAEPQQIAALLSNLPSDTVDAPRNLSASLITRLEEIASHHGGRVPLHGRLFAQLMHHAYPRECPFPHVAGTTNPMTPDEWIAANREVVATQSEMEMHVSKANATHHHADELEALPWTSVEELVAIHEPTVVGETSFLSWLAKVVLLVAFACLVAPSLMDSHVRIRDMKQAESKLPRYLV